MTHHPILSINLSALAANYRRLQMLHAHQHIAAVVKANAYGLGMEAVSQRLWDEGCRMFFVATLAEGVALRAALPEARIGVFSGLFAGEEKDYNDHRLTPVLNDLGQVERFARMTDAGLPITGIVHVDTGMTRLGLTLSDIENIRRPSSVHCPLIMSHLACASDPKHPKNNEQLARFRAALRYFPGAKASLANSAGLFLSPDFHFDMGRPGCALYGINPVAGDNPMQHVATLSAPILQIRTLDREETVGYNATYSAAKGDRIAILGMGYADGWLRALSNRSNAYISGHAAPIAGIVSMDMIAVNVSQLPDSALASASDAQLINTQQPVDEVARLAGTIGYEIFTRIGNRVERVYVR